MFKKRLNILILVLIVITLFSAVILTSIFIRGEGLITLNPSNIKNRKTFTKEINSDRIKNLSINTDVAKSITKKIFILNTMLIKIQNSVLRKTL